MQVIVIKDGTVPVAIAKVVATDGPDFDVQKHISAEDPNSDAHQFVEAFEVGDDTRFLGVTWFEGDGFNVVGFENLGKALNWLKDDSFGGTVPVEAYSGGHWGTTYNPGDDEGYGHVFDIRF